MPRRPGQARVQTERQWVDFAVRGPAAFGPEVDWSAVDWSNLEADDGVAASFAERAATFQMAPGETVAALLTDYEAVAANTERTVAGLDLNASHRLPSAPWFEPGAEWSVRRAILHMIAETAQHAGHADILRETIDGAKTMGSQLYLRPAELTTARADRRCSRATGPGARSAALSPRPCA